MMRRADGEGGFWTGVLAGAGATLVLFVSRAAWGIPMPQEALGERIVRMLPDAVFTLLLAELQHLAKPAGFALAVALSLAGFGAGGALYACVAGRSRRPVPFLGLVAAAGTWLVLADIVLPLLEGGTLGEPLTIVVPAGPWLAIASAVYGLLLAYLRAPPHAPDQARSQHPTRAVVEASMSRSDRARFPAASGGTFGRRGLLRRSGLALVLASLASRVGTGSPPRRPRQAAVPSGARGAAPQPFHLIRGMPGEVTPSARFFQVSKNFPFDPVVDVAAWSLAITGRVATPLRLSYAQFVAAAAPVERYQTLECVGNPVGGDLIGTARWKGVRVRDLLSLAGVRDSATAIVWRSADGYSESVPLSVAMDPESLLAYAMNGRPLPRQHGAPVRVLLPNRYGMKQPKWLTAVEVAEAGSLGRWERLRFTNPAIVKISSACLAETQRVGTVQLGGWAFAGRRGIANVEISADGGATWLAAAVKPALGESCWQFWSAEWTPPGPGEYLVTVRARDGTGTLQPGRRRRMPDGAEGYYELPVRVRG
ncbi:MAG TPA: molybdopterin-dependent oxidoreductase [bacterium]|nr:molybdopterin-dependent oxidoreductase [bacterium]